MLIRTLAATLTAVAGACLGLACDASPGGPEDTGTPVQSDFGESVPSQVASAGSGEASPSPVPVIIGEARWPTLYGQSLKDIASAYDTIVIGRVADVEVLAGAVLGSGGTSETPPTGHPKASSWPVVTQAAPESRYAVLVERVIKGSRVAVGGAATVFQRGGTIGGVTYQVAHDPPLITGGQYLLFLEDLQPQMGLDLFSGSPFGRFQIDARGYLAPVDGEWSELPAVKALTGLTVEAATALVKAAVHQP